MWMCPKCGREFRNTNQNHSCGDKPANIDENEKKVSDIISLIKETLNENDVNNSLLRLLKAF